MITYKGRCHCGAVSFEFKAEQEITGAIRCNCSICKRKNAIMSRAYYAAAHFKLQSGADQMTVYRFGDKDVNHNFCRVCGIYPFHGDDTVGYRVNLGCVDQIRDPAALPLRVFDGADSFQYKAGEFQQQRLPGEDDDDDDDEPTGQIEVDVGDLADEADLPLDEIMKRYQAQAAGEEDDSDDDDDLGAAEMEADLGDLQDEANLPIEEIMKRYQAQAEQSDVKRRKK